jgi:hypothetical protein
LQVYFIADLVAWIEKTAEKGTRRTFIHSEGVQVYSERVKKVRGNEENRSGFDILTDFCFLFYVLQIRFIADLVALSTVF